MHEHGTKPSFHWQRRIYYIVILLFEQYGLLIWHRNLLLMIKITIISAFIFIYSKVNWEAIWAQAHDLLLDEK